MFMNFLGSSKARKTVAAVAALGVAQVSLMAFADAPAPWVQKAEHKKKKKKAVRRAPHRKVKPVQTVQTTPAPQVAEAPAPVYQAPPPPPAPEPVPAPPAPAPAPAEPPLAIPAAAASHGTGWLLPVLGVLGAGGVIAAVASSDSK